MTSNFQRLQKILSAFGVSSRRGAEKMIIDGRVRVNGKTAVLGQSANPDTDLIELDGKPLGSKEQSVYIMLNKPRGYLTTVTDDRERPTVMELVAGAGTRVYPVGRLDMDSEGLLLFTNDGEFANKVAHPSNEKSKTYEVEVEGNAAGAVKQLGRHMIIDGHTVRAVSVRLISETETGGIIRIVINEGRNRQIRKMCAACKVAVTSLRRVSIGSLKLGTLETGKWRYLTKEEVESLCKTEA